MPSKSRKHARSGRERGGGTRAHARVVPPGSESARFAGGAGSCSKLVKLYGFDTIHDLMPAEDRNSCNTCSEWRLDPAWQPLSCCQGQHSWEHAGWRDSAMNSASDSTQATMTTTMARL